MSNTLEKHFVAMGARLRVEDMAVPIATRSRWRFEREMIRQPRRNNITLNVRNGEFILRVGEGVVTNVINVDPKDRHLLLHVNDNGAKSKYLCGHDERDWFIATIPDQAVSTVVQAKQALQPDSVREASKRVRTKNRLRRRNSAFVRQGEWFFTLDPNFEEPPANLVHRNDPISRGRGSKPHIVEFLYRLPGRTVYMAGSRAISAEEFNAIPAVERRRNAWVARTEVTAVWAKGRVSHPDHATITLDGWHRIEMNREQLAAAGSSSAVTFID